MAKILDNVTDVNARLAKELMGWKIRDYDEFGTWIYRRAYRGAPIQLDKWSPTTKWEHTGEVLTEIERRGWEWELHMHKNKEGNPDYVMLIFPSEDLSEALNAWADDPKVAICLGALDAIGWRS